MLPLTLDLARLRVALAGNGEAAVNRLRLLEAAGATELRVFAATPSAELVDAAGPRLRRFWPGQRDLAAIQFLFIADLDADARAALVAAARQAGTLLHVEDAPVLSDSQMPAVLRRGDLIIAVSTSGGAPGLASAVKDWLTKEIGVEWQGRLEDVRSLRQAWRAAGALPVEVKRLTAELIARRGWLKPVRRAANDRTARRATQP